MFPFYLILYLCSITFYTYKLFTLLIFYSMTFTGQLILPQKWTWCVVELNGDLFTLNSFFSLSLSLHNKTFLFQVHVIKQTNNRWWCLVQISPCEDWMVNLQSVGTKTCSQSLPFEFNTPGLNHKLKVLFQSLDWNEWSSEINGETSQSSKSFTRRYRYDEAQSEQWSPVLNWDFCFCQLHLKGRFFLFFPWGVRLETLVYTGLLALTRTHVYFQEVSSTQLIAVDSMPMLWMGEAKAADPRLQGPTVVAWPGHGIAKASISQPASVTLVQPLEPPGGVELPDFGDVSSILSTGLLSLRQVHPVRWLQVVNCPCGGRTDVSIKTFSWFHVIVWIDTVQVETVCLQFLFCVVIYFRGRCFRSQTASCCSRSDSKCLRVLKQVAMNQSNSDVNN